MIEFQVWHITKGSRVHFQKITKSYINICIFNRRVFKIISWQTYDNDFRE